MSLSYTDITLEKFIKNYSMMFLTPQQQFAFHIYVYCNRSTDQKATASLNNVYSNINFQYFVVHGPQTRDKIKELTEQQQATRGLPMQGIQDKTDIDKQIQFLFDKGFIVRQAKYTSMADKITKSSQLMFKPEKFINQHRSYLKTWKDELEKQGLQDTQYKSQYYCIGSCKANHYVKYTEDEIADITIQLQTTKIENIRCPHCKDFNCVRMAQKQQNQSAQNLLYPIVCELFLQSDELFKRNQEDSSYLDRELQSMRSKYNDFVIRKIRTQRRQNTYITPVDRINTIKKRFNQLQSSNELDKQSTQQNNQQNNQQDTKEILNPAFQFYSDRDREYLEYAEAGIDVKSIHQKSSIVKSERSVVGGVGEFGKVLWQDAIKRKAEQILND